MHGTAFSIALASSAGKRKDKLRDRLTKLTTKSLTLRRNFTEGDHSTTRTHELLSLSISTTCGTALSISLTSLAGEQKSRGGPDR